MQDHFFGLVLLSYIRTIKVVYNSYWSTSRSDQVVNFFNLAIATRSVDKVEIDPFAADFQWIISLYKNLPVFDWNSQRGGKSKTWTQFFHWRTPEFLAETAITTPATKIQSSLGSLFCGMNAGCFKCIHFAWSLPIITIRRDSIISTEQKFVATTDFMGYLLLHATPNLIEDFECGWGITHAEQKEDLVHDQVV